MHTRNAFAIKRRGDEEDDVSVQGTAEDDMNDSPVKNNKRGESNEESSTELGSTQTGEKARGG